MIAVVDASPIVPTPFWYATKTLPFITERSSGPTVPRGGNAKIVTVNPPVVAIPILGVAVELERVAAPLGTSAGMTTMQSNAPTPATASSTPVRGNRRITPTALRDGEVCMRHPKTAG